MPASSTPSHRRQLEQGIARGAAALARSPRSSPAAVAATTPPTAVLTKAEFIKQGDAICARQRKSKTTSKIRQENVCRTGLHRAADRSRRGSLPLLAAGRRIARSARRGRRGEVEELLDSRATKATTIRPSRRYGAVAATACCHDSPSRLRRGREAPRSRRVCADRVSSYRSASSTRASASARAVRRGPVATTQFARTTSPRCDSTTDGVRRSLEQKARSGSLGPSPLLADDLRRATARAATASRHRPGRGRARRAAARSSTSPKTNRRSVVGCGRGVADRRHGTGAL